MSRELDIMELIGEIIELKKQISEGWCPEFEYRVTHKLCDVGTDVWYPRKFKSCSACTEKYFEDMEKSYLKKYKINIDNF